MSSLQVMYNGQDVFQKVISLGSIAEVLAIDWNCSDEFTASPSSAISFLKENSYLSFHQNYPRKGGTLHLSLKTQATDALLMYATGPPSR